MTRRKTQARKCRFRDAVETDERLIEQLIMGVRHVQIQEKLLSRDDQLTLDIAMDIARTHDATLGNMQQFAGETSISHLSRVNKRWPAHRNNQREDQPTCTKCNACGLLYHCKSVCRNQTPRRSQNEMPCRGRQSKRFRAKSRNRTPQRREDHTNRRADRRNGGIHSVQ